ncbi:hypothetical protein MOVI109754_15070 [Moritella viscosa]|uniref:Succinate-semialdehyde dehydrogenase (NADP+) n=2 Tax=Moritella viscosa TaxID=80854 RepID=A0ABY1HJ32_9GAMM|nr:Succinate-semialdehyde dehydrogenase (NADP+) [Moritella viscosa]SGZ06392.1 Succinate-semialdehyde dehydrogenase (NADP+) [Moritella viscosa]SGZ07967.1 Succinate-semialdehyde dehydrogenase (NADP+) [Moritella viscosa]SGZ15502.1 Succinate-semialdehyde dehydrogenase (NADP+) [Moritella viscosa]SHO28259.1 Succinate-semialdehyde dehydrogenase (NADP+) [Moritella viscosa]
MDMTPEYAAIVGEKECQSLLTIRNEGPTLVLGKEHELFGSIAAVYKGIKYEELGLTLC